MNWVGGQSIKMMVEVKRVAEEMMGRKCAVRQLLHTPNVFEIEFNLETPEERTN